MATIAIDKASARIDALELLRADHRQIVDLMDIYATGQETMEVAKKVTLVVRLCKALAVHSTIELEIFYPAIGETVEGVSMLLDMAEVELASIGHLSDDLSVTTPAVDPRYDAKVAVVSRFFKDHARFEETQLFPKIRKTALELTALGEQLSLRRKEVIAAIGNTELQS